MRRAPHSFHCLITLLGSLIAAPVGASHVLVPDDLPTVQEAIDSGADTVYVKDGIFRERVVIPRAVVLLNWPSPDPYGVDAFPTVGGVSILLPQSSQGQIYISGLYIAGKVEIPYAQFSPGYSRVAFVACRMDSGPIQNGTRAYTAVYNITIRGCTIFGPVKLVAGYVDFTMNTVIRGGVSIVTEGYEWIRGNHVEGAPNRGIDTEAEEGKILGNSVSGAQAGIHVVSLFSVLVAHNKIADCSGDGCVVTYRAHVSENVISRCGGRGIVTTPGDRTRVHCTNNRIDTVGGDGMYFDEGGRYSSASGNVIGHAGGNGINAPSGGVDITNNTSYANAGSGYAVVSYNTFNNNIAFGNLRYGLEIPTESAHVSCNDWFNNGLGAVSTGSPGATDLAVDPMFCDVASGNVSLMEGSPLVDAAGCGLMGALGVGCPGGPTATLVSGFQASWVGRSVRVQWHIGDATNLRATALQRSGSSAGPWVPVTAPQREADGAVVVEDGDAKAGVSCLYRLVATLASGQTETFGPISAASDALTELALSAAAPNPSAGDAVITFSLPSESRVRLSVLDVQGREVAVLAEGVRRPGSYKVAIGTTGTGGMIPPGVYFARYEAGGRALVRRIVLSR